MLYILLKAIHVIAVIFWIGSLGMLTLITSVSRLSAEQMRVATRLTDAAIGASWLAGIVLVLMGGWYTATWWQIKIVLVIVISAVHTMVHRRWKNSSDERAQTQDFVPIVVFVVSIAVVFLAVYKQPL